MLEEVKINYREYVCDGASSTNPRVRLAAPIPTRPDPAPDIWPSIPRRMRITPADLMTYGYTVGCPGCEVIQAGEVATRNHKEECRATIQADGFPEFDCDASMRKKSALCFCSINQNTFFASSVSAGAGIIVSTPRALGADADG